MCGLCVCVWTHATVSVLMLPQSETSQAIPQKPQYCLVNTGTHTHLQMTHTQAHCDPVFPRKQFTVLSVSLMQTQTKASVLCSANPTV